MNCEPMEIDSSPTELVDLPNEVLTKIFENLDISSLHSVALVCKKFEYLIGQCAQIMRKFTLNIENSKIDKFDQDFKSKRRHVNVHIHLEKEFEHGLKILKRFDLSQTRRLSVHRYKSSMSLSKLRKIVERMKLLEDASLLINKVDVKKSSSLTNIKLPRFKRVRFYPVAANALKLFNPSQIIETRIEESPLDNLAKVAKFLEETENLKILRINKSTFNMLFQKYRNFKFQLEAIDMMYLGTIMTEVVAENFSNFLLSQRSSLKIADLNGLEFIPKNVLHKIFAKLTLLERLTIDASCLPVSKDFYDDFSTNLNMKTLILHKGFSSNASAKCLLSKYPNLEHLVMKFSISSKINFIAKQNPNLISLSCEWILRSVAPGVKFHNLKALTVDQVTEVNHWMSVIKNSPKIETLTVKWVEKQITDEVIDDLLQQPSLRHLHLTGSYESMNKIFDKLKSDHGELRSLNIATRLQSTDRVFAKIQFLFPEDKSQWNVRNEEKKFADCIWDVLTKQTESQAFNFNNVIKFKFETSAAVMEVNPANMELSEPR